MMRSRLVQIFCIVAVAVSATAAVAQNPFLGEWKRNNDKSHLTGDIVQFSPAPDGAIKYTAETRSYTFKTDGKEYTNGTGAQVVWKKIDDDTYERTSSRNGIPIGTATFKIASDGKTMVEEIKGTDPGGQTFDDTTTYTRVSGSKGLMGSWKDTNVNLKEDFTMNWKPLSSPDSMHWELPTLNAYVDITYDGKDYTPVGPTVPKGLTISLTKTGPHTLLVVQKLNGKLLSRSTFRLSADGKTLTEVQTPPDGKAPATIIYTKQGSRS
jgi:hypothetical protein